MERKHTATCFTGFVIGFLTFAIFSFGLPAGILTALKHSSKMLTFGTLLMARLATIYLYRFNAIRAAIHPFSFLLGLAEGALFQSLVLSCITVSFAQPFPLNPSFILATAALLAGGLIALLKLKNSAIGYAVAVYLFLIPAGMVFAGNLKTIVKPPLLKKCYDIDGKGLQKIFTYPDCLTGKHPNICKQMFETGTVYDVAYHEKTRRIIATGRESGLLLLLKGNGQPVKAINTGLFLNFITYNRYKDVFYISARAPGRLIELDPETGKIRNAPLSHLGLAFQRGCLRHEGRTLLYISDATNVIALHNFDDKSEKLHHIPAFSLIFPYDVKCLDGTVAISIGLQTPIFSETLWLLDADNAFKPLHSFRSLFPLYDLVADDGILYAASPANGRIYAFDADTLEIKRRYKAPRGVRSIDINSKKKVLYAGSFSSGKIVKIDIRTGKFLKEWNVGPLLRNIEFAPESGRLFAAGQCGVFELME